MKIMVCDYINPHTKELESFVHEYEDNIYDEAVRYLKSLGVPKRNIVNLEEF